MNEQQKTLIKDTVPTLQSNGVALASHFYQRMLTHNPELKNIFNQAHQRNGRQQQALAGAVLAYAQHIDDPSALLPVMNRIANKHVSLGIRAEHYSIVGRHLLASIQEVLGNTATDELIEAWANAYHELAQLFISIENNLYQKTIDTIGGWTGWRPFRIASKQRESSAITSFYFKPLDGGPLPTYKPGQYISVYLYIPELNVYQPRQYSLSDIANEEYLRISVKRESATETTPAGIVSNLLHDHYNVGDIVDLSAPAGDFFLQQFLRPVVLISGGVGITPMIAIGKELQRQQRPFTFVHSAKNRHVHAFWEVTQHFAEEGADVYYFYDQIDTEKPHVRKAPFNLTDILPREFLTADYYVCGPNGFMQRYLRELRKLGVPEQQLFAEVFGSGGLPA